MPDSPKVDPPKAPVKQAPKAEATMSPPILFLDGIIHNPMFDHGMGIVIMLNMGVIIVDTDHAANSDDELAWSSFVGWAILIIFIIELIVRLIVLGRTFFYDHWNTFDFLIVVTDGSFSFFGLIFGSVFPVSTLRVFRLCKLARVSKVFRVFPELRIMMAGLLGSVRAIFWGSVLLAFVLLVWAIVAVQFIHPLNRDLAERGILDDCERCPRAYESVLQSTLTFSQQIVAGDSWGQATIPVIEAFPVTAIYFMGVFLSVGFAVMNLILGVVVNVAQSEHDRLKGEIEDEKNIARMEASNNLVSICQDMDQDGSGELSKEELLNGYKEREDFRAAIEELDLVEDDMAIAFASMDADRSGSVSYNEFVKKIYKMKDTDAQFLMEQVKYNIMSVKDLILNTMLKQQNELLALEHAELKMEESTNALAQDMALEQANQSDTLRTMAGISEEKAGAVGSSSSKEVVAAVEGLEQEVKALEQEVKATGDASAQVDAAFMKRIEDSLSGVSETLQGEVRSTLQKIEANLALHMSNSTTLLSEFQAQKPNFEDLKALNQQAVSQNLSASPAMCCSGRPPQQV